VGQGLAFSAWQLDLMIDHLEGCLPEEGCGLVGGRDGRATLILPVENELHSPVRFLMKPIDQFRAMERIEGEGLELAAIFHSHPNGPDHPSPTDLTEFYYPGSLVLIASRPGAGGAQAGENGETGLGLSVRHWLLRGFEIETPQIIEVKLRLFA